MENSENLSAVSVLGVIAGFATIAGLSFFARRFFVSNQSQIKKESNLDEAILNCQAQDDSQISDLINIKEALAKYNQEAGYLINKITSSTLKKKHNIGNVASYSSVNQHSFAELDNTNEQSLLLRQCHELIDNYPESSFDENSTIEDVESYYNASEVHHEKVLMVAEYLIPELSSLLNESKIKNGKSIQL